MRCLHPLWCLHTEGKNKSFWSLGLALYSFLYWEWNFWSDHAVKVATHGICMALHLSFICSYLMITDRSVMQCKPTHYTNMLTCSMQSRVPLSCMLKKKDLEANSEPTTRTHSFSVLDSGHRGKHCRKYTHTHAELRCYFLTTKHEYFIKPHVHLKRGYNCKDHI